MKKLLNLLLITTIVLTTACGAESKEVEPELTLNMSMQEIMGTYEATLLAGQSADTKFLDGDLLESLYGIAPDMYVDYEGRQSIDTEQWCDEYMFIEAADGQVEAIVEAIKSRTKALSTSEELSEEHRNQVKEYKVYVRENFVVAAFGMNPESCIQHFQGSFVEE